MLRARCGPAKTCRITCTPPLFMHRLVSTRNSRSIGSPGQVVPLQHTCIVTKGRCVRARAHRSGGNRGIIHLTGRRTHGGRSFFKTFTWPFRRVPEQRRKKDSRGSAHNSNTSLCVQASNGGAAWTITAVSEDKDRLQTCEPL